VGAALSLLFYSKGDSIIHYSVQSIRAIISTSRCQDKEATKD